MKIKGYMGTRGETMIEVVSSLALFGVTMLMITVLLGTASRIYTKNYKQEVQFEKQVNALNNDVAAFVDGSDATWDFKYKGKSGEDAEEELKVDFHTKLFKADDADNSVSLLKFKSAD